MRGCRKSLPLSLLPDFYNIMSALPEPFSFETKRKPLAFSIHGDESVPVDGEIRLDAESVFTSELQDVTFISPGGEGHRLFAEEEDSLLGATFSLKQQANPIDPDRQTTDVLRLFSGESTLSCHLQTEELPAFLLDDSENKSSQDTTDEPNKTRPTTISDKTFKRIRAVEGVCGRNQKTIQTQLFDELSDSVVPRSNPNARTQLVFSDSRPVIRKTSVELKLFESKKKPETRKPVTEPPIERPLLDPAVLFPFVQVPTELLKLDIQTALKTNQQIASDSTTNETESHGTKPKATKLKATMPDLPEDKPKSVRPTASRPTAMKQSDIQTEISATLTASNEIRPIQVIRIDTPSKADRRITARAFPKKGIRDFLDDKRTKHARQPEHSVGAGDAVEMPAKESERLVESSMSSGVVSEPKQSELPSLDSVKAFVEAARTDLSLGVEEITPTYSRPLWQPTWPKNILSLRDQAAQQIRLLCDHLEACHADGARIVSFNSFFPREGCTTTTACAARELAQRGHQLLLADANQQDPSLARMLGVPSDHELFGIVSLEDRLDFLPWSGVPIEIETETGFLNQSFAQLVASIREDYDMILLDNGRLSESRFGERIRFWNDITSDGILLVVNTNNASKINLNSIAGRLKRRGVKLLGITENRVP